MNRYGIALLVPELVHVVILFDFSCILLGTRNNHVWLPLAGLRNNGLISSVEPDN